MSQTESHENPQTRCTVDIEVRYAETDQMGLVHHANYVIWFELARTELCRLSGTPYAEIEKLGYWLIVTRVELRYAQSARYGETVQVDCWLEKHTSRGLRFGYEVRRGEQKLVSGNTEHLWVDAETGRPCRAPEPLRQQFARLNEQAGAANP